MRRYGVVLFIFLVCMIFFVPAAAEAAVYTEQLTHNSSNIGTPAMLKANDNGIVAWYDTRDGDAEVYMFNSKTGVETKITNNTTQDTWVDIDNNYIVWTENYKYIHYYNISTGVTTGLPASITGDMLRISDGKIYYRKYGWNCYDIASGTSAHLTYADGWYDLSVDGDYFAYAYHYGDISRVGIYKVSAGQTIWTTDYIGYYNNSELPIIKGKFLTWTGSYGSYQYLVNFIDSPHTARYTSDSGMQYREMVSNSGDGRIIYMSKGGQYWNGSYYAYDYSIKEWDGLGNNANITNVDSYAGGTYDSNSAYSLYNAMSYGRMYFFRKDSNGRFQLWLAIDDREGPDIGSITANYGDSATYSNTVSLSLTYHDRDSWVTHMQFANEDDVWSDWVPVSESYNGWELSFGPGNKTVKVRFKDSNGNLSNSYSDTIQVKQDATGPLVSMIIANGSSYITTSSTTLQMTAIDNLTPVNNLKMRLSNDNATWTEWENYAPVKAWSVTSGDGIKTVYLQVRDAEMNITAVSDTVYLSTASPTGTASSSTTDQILLGSTFYIKDNDITLSLTNTGAAQVRYSIIETLWSDWEAVSAAKGLQLPAGDGKKKVKIQLKNSLERESPVYTVNFLLDTEAPSFSLKTLNGATATTNGTITLEVTDLNDNISTAGFLYSVNGEAQALMAADGRIVVTGLAGGLQTIKVKIYDQAGNSREKTIHIWSL